MKCPICQHENPDGVQFCTLCGQVVSAPAPCAHPVAQNEEVVAVPLGPIDEILRILKITLLPVIAAVPCGVYGAAQITWASGNSDSYAASYQEIFGALAIMAALIMSVATIWVMNSESKTAFGCAVPLMVLVGVQVTAVFIILVGSISSPQPRQIAFERSAPTPIQYPIGETVEMCGLVAHIGYYFSPKTNSSDAVLYFDYPPPSHAFRVIISSSDRGAFPGNLDFYQNKNVCVTGLVESYSGTAQIVATRGDQLEIR